MKKIGLLTMFCLLFATNVFAFTTRQITNTAPLTNQVGTVLANVAITFTLVDRNKRPADGWDAISHERIAPIPVTVRTNSLGIFSVYLWPTARSTTERYYLCHVESRYSGIADFIAALDNGSSYLEWIIFKAAGGVLVPNGNSVFSVHTGDQTIHVTPTEKEALDAANAPTSNNPYATILDMQQAGVLGLPITTNMDVVLSSDYGCASGWQAGALATEIATLVSAGISASNILCRDIQ